MPNSSPKRYSVEDDIFNDGRWSKSSHSFDSLLDAVKFCKRRAREWPTRVFDNVRKEHLFLILKDRIQVLYNGER